MGRAFLETQLEFNTSQQDFAKTKFSLEQRILELEGEHAQELAYMVSLTYNSLAVPLVSEQIWVIWILAHVPAGRGCSCECTM